ncbi:unnamed protein product [Lampetra planeri]
MHGCCAILHSGGPALEGPIRFGSWRFALGLLLLLCAGGLTGTWAQPLRQPTAHGDSHTTAHVACCSYVQGSKTIDPNWYVDRGVRPIGRYGKRLLAGSRSPSPPNRPLWRAVERRSQQRAERQAAKTQQVGTVGGTGVVLTYL